MHNPERFSSPGGGEPARFSSPGGESSARWLSDNSMSRESFGGRRFGEKLKVLGDRCTNYGDEHEIRAYLALVYCLNQLESQRSNSPEISREELRTYLTELLNKAAQQSWPETQYNVFRRLIRDLDGVLAAK